MTLKKAVLISLITVFSLMAIVLIIGLVIPEKTLQGWSKPQTADELVMQINGGSSDLEQAQQVSTNTPSADGAAAAVPSDQPTSVQPDTVTSQPVTTAPTPTPTPTPTPNPAPTPTPTPSGPACGTAGGACTTAQIAAHNTPGDCWTIYGSNYLILSGSGVVGSNGNLVTNHSGGASKITPICGTDSTTAFNNKHGGQNNVKNIYNSYIVGPVQ